MVESQSTIPMESETWNNARGFSTYHVLFPLIEARKLVKLCLFGVEEPGQEVGVPKTILNLNKINAINRLLQELQQIVQDNDFVMDKQTKELMDGLQERLDSVEQVIDGISRETTDSRNGHSETVLNEEHYKNCLKELRLILSEIKKPLNMKNLIFPASDELDLDKLKEEIVQGG